VERSELQKVAHYKAEAEMYLHGRPQIEIAAALGISLNTVKRDLKLIQAGWLEKAQADFDKKKSQELARIDWLEQEAVGAWFESKKESTVTAVKSLTGDRTQRESSIKKVKRTGNPDYLATIQWCIEARCKIFGFYAPIKFSATELDKKIEELLAAEKLASETAIRDSELASDQLQ